jgi:hypothetical protein
MKVIHIAPLVIAALLAFPGCNSSNTETQATKDSVAEVEADQRQAPLPTQEECRKLSEDDCLTTDGCWAYEAYPHDKGCLVDSGSGGEAIYPQFLTCGASHGELMVCSSMMTWGHPEDSPEEQWFFYNLCLPVGWMQTDDISCDD